MMRSKFDEQLDRLNKEMMKMGSAIEDSIRKAVDALVKQDAELAKKVMLQDEEIDREQKTIESIFFNLLIQQQPVAWSPILSKYLATIRRSAACSPLEQMQPLL